MLQQHRVKLETKPKKFEDRVLVRAWVLGEERRCSREVGKRNGWGGAKEAKPKGEGRTRLGWCSGAEGEAGDLQGVRHLGTQLRSQKRTKALWPKRLR